MAQSSALSTRSALAACLLLGGLVGSCAVTEQTASCSEAELDKTSRVAEQVWQTLDASEPDEEGAYCDSSPYPYAGGSMDGPASEVAARATDSMGCKETSVEGLDSEEALLLACDINGEPYLLEIARQLDRFGGPGLEVGLYKR